MNLDDVIYLGLLLSTIVFGCFYRKINDPNLKKNVGSLVGLLVILSVSGVHILHPLLSTVIAAQIILHVSKKKCHIATFVFCFLYLFFFRTTVHFGVPYPPAHTNLIQMILTLKLVGLSLEVSSSHENKKRKDSSSKSEEEKYEEKHNDIDNLKFIDILHYSFNYVGILTGPYYRYRTFVDSIEKPYIKYDNWKDNLIEKLKYVPIFAIFFLVASHYWPLSYALSDEFYNERSWLYRYWYIWPNFFIFRMRIYIGLLLSESACVTAGLGLYPAITQPKSGHGPSQQFKCLVESKTPKELESLEYNYKTIYNINPYGSDFCVTYREGMKHWNICVQYWLAVNVYKKFPFKKLRTIATLMISAVWHGVWTGYYVCIGTVPFGLMVEDIWVQLLLKDHQGTALKRNEWFVWFYKMKVFSYQAIAFHLLEINKIIKYFNSIYHVGLIIHLFWYVVGLQLLKAKKSKEQKITKEQKGE
ncbi:unnamed protein product [Brassicogethes aeneus]|uniref:Lysophospholipid acyltransferase 7 n=1 Tax=Brassicogethes aeneus TaxID=1431903 RepID=A0A9P0BIK1_BRAAE|nr:unnamed protein product [Brassicogethes aeneus]